MSRTIMQIKPSPTETKFFYDKTTWVEYLVKVVIANGSPLPPQQLTLLVRCRMMIKAYTMRTLTSMAMFDKCVAVLDILTWVAIAINTTDHAFEDNVEMTLTDELIRSLYELNFQNHTTSCKNENKL